MALPACPLPACRQPAVLLHAAHCTVLPWDLQVLVLPLAARADERALAALLHTSRGRVRLAPEADLQRLCGYRAGSVPPFAHRPSLPVIVDSAVLAFERCYAGGGSEEAEVFIGVPELLRAAGAAVADISKPGSGSTADSSSDGVNGGSDGGGWAAASADAATVLPVPWPAGQAGLVRLEGVVAHRRKIARLLMFVSLVPLESVAQARAASGANGTNAASRAKVSIPACVQAPLVCSSELQMMLPTPRELLPRSLAQQHCCAGCGDTPRQQRPARCS